MRHCPNCAAIVEASDARCAACGADFSAASAWKPVKKAPRLDTTPRSARELRRILLSRAGKTLAALVAVTVPAAFGGDGAWFTLFGWLFVGFGSVFYLAYPIYRYFISTERLRPDKPADFEPEREQPTCCPKAHWSAERDVGSSQGFEFDLGKCDACGTPWMKVWCVAASLGGYEPLSRAESWAIKDAPPEELATIAKKWGRRLA